MNDATAAAQVTTYGEVIVVGADASNNHYNAVQYYTTQAAVEVDFSSSTAIGKATAKVFSQGVPHVRVLNVYSGSADEYATCLAKLVSDQVDYDIIVPTIEANATGFSTLVSHATTYKKVLICPAVSVTVAQAIAKMVPVTKDETQYAIASDLSGNTAGELAGAVGGVISAKKPWVPPEWASISGINPSTYSPSDLALLEGDASNNVNAVITVGTATVLSSGKSLEPGSWIDILRTKQYLSDSIRTELINLKLRLANSNQKIPYDALGLKMVQGTIERCCRLAQAAGALRVDYVDEDTQEVVKGYLVTVPDYADISASDKSARLLQNISVVAYLSGAISSITLDLTVTL